MDRKILEFPNEMEQFPVDPMDIEKCCVSGLFREGFSSDSLEDTYEMLTYLPVDMHNGAAHWIIVPPSGISPLEFFYESGVQALAEREHFFAHILCTPEGQTWESIPNRKEYTSALWKQITARIRYVGCAGGTRAVYVLGAGDGGCMAYQMAAGQPEWFAGVCVYHACLSHISLGGMEKGLPLPMWILAKSPEALPERFEETWKKRNHCLDREPLPAKEDVIYDPDPEAKDGCFNDSAAAPFRITYIKKLEENTPYAVFRRLLPDIWKFLSVYRRHIGAGAPYIRRYTPPESVGAVGHWMDHAGYRRRWCEYIPDKPPFDENKGYPLVVALHGRGGTPEAFFDSTRMWKVAQERRFIVVFPQAHCYQQHGPHGIQNVSMWNYPDGDLHADSIGFIRRVVASVKERFHVDAGRVYCCGQSSGGMMSVQMALYASDVFAAAASWSTGSLPYPGVQVTRPAIPLFLMRGERDGLPRQKRFPEYPFSCNTVLKGTLDYFLERYGIEKTAKEYTSGIYHYYVYEAEGVPMVTFVNVRDMPHASIAEESWLVYDLFMSRFSRAENGVLLYMGKPYPA